MYVLLKYVDIINFVFMYCMVYLLFLLNIYVMCSDMCEIVLFIEFDLYLIFCDGILFIFFMLGEKIYIFLIF